MNTSEQTINHLDNLIAICKMSHANIIYALNAKTKCIAAGTYRDTTAGERIWNARLVLNHYDRIASEGYNRINNIRQCEGIKPIMNPYERNDI